MQGNEQVVAFDEITSSQKRAIYWGFLWRVFAITLCSLVAALIVGFVAGLLAGLVAALMGTNIQDHPHSVQLVGALVGLGVSCYAWWHYVRWLFSVPLGGFRLRLVRDSPDAVRQPDAADRGA